MLDCLTDRGNLPADAEAFEHALACTPESPFGPLGTRFALGKPIYVVRAPARLDCMGGIADYSGSLVCEMTLDRAVLMGLQARDDRKVVVHSAGVDELGLSPDVTLALDDLAPDPGAVDYDTVRRRMSAASNTAWAAYVAGAFSVLQGEGHMDRFPPRRHDRTGEQHTFPGRRVLLCRAGNRGHAWPEPALRDQP